MTTPLPACTVATDRAVGALRHLLAAAPLALAWAPARHFIEAHMVLHMMLEFPMLLASGLMVHHLSRHWRAAERLAKRAEAADWHGWVGAVAVLLVAMTWMLPTMLDLAVLEPAVAAAKYASWWATGWLLAGSLSRMDPEGRLFTTGNLAWMMGTAGMLYLESEQRLCVNYLWDDQQLTGYALVAAATALGLSTFWLMLRSHSQTRNTPDAPSIQNASAQLAKLHRSGLPVAAAASRSTWRQRFRNSTTADAGQGS